MCEILEVHSPYSSANGVAPTNGATGTNGHTDPSQVDTIVISDSDEEDDAFQSPVVHVKGSVRQILCCYKTLKPALKNKCSSLFEFRLMKWESDAGLSLNSAFVFQEKKAFESFCVQIHREDDEWQTQRAVHRQSQSDQVRSFTWSLFCWFREVLWPPIQIQTRVCSLNGLVFGRPGRKIDWMN